MVKGFSLGLVKVLSKQIMSLDFSGLNSSMNFFGCYESARKTGKFFKTPHFQIFFFFWVLFLKYDFFFLIFFLDHNVAFKNTN